MSGIHNILMTDHVPSGCLTRYELHIGPMDILVFRAGWVIEQYHSVSFLDLTMLDHILSYEDILLAFNVLDTLPNWESDNSFSDSSYIKLPESQFEYDYYLPDPENLGVCAFQDDKSGAFMQYKLIKRINK